MKKKLYLYNIYLVSEKKIKVPKLVAALLFYFDKKLKCFFKVRVEEADFVEIKKK